MLKALQKLFFWNYARNTWQWDILCVVILIFIFLTPKSWFENGERRGLAVHPSPSASVVFIAAELIENAEDKDRMEQRVREVTGRRNVQVVGVRKVVGYDGKTRGYEVDIR